MTCQFFIDAIEGDFALIGEFPSVKGTRLQVPVVDLCLWTVKQKPNSTTLASGAYDSVDPIQRIIVIICFGNYKNEPSSKLQP